MYQKFINSEDQIISKTYMTRGEGENTKLRHYLASLGRKTLCYSKSAEMLEYSVRPVLNSATKVHKFESGKVLNEKIFCYK